MATEESENLLQWRKLSGEAPRTKGTDSAARPPAHSSTGRKERRGKVSRQDAIAAEARLRRRRISDAAKRAPVPPRDERRHIVQGRKAQFSHLTTQKDADGPPIVYALAREGQSRGEATPLRLQPFTVIDNY